MALTTGLEPVTSWLTVKRSTDWAMWEYFGADERNWTFNLRFTRPLLYRLSYISSFRWLYRYVIGENQYNHRNARKVVKNESLRVVSGRNYRSCTCLDYYNSDIRPRQLFWAWALHSQLIILIYYLSDCYFIMFTSTRITKNSCYYWFNIRVIDIVAKFFLLRFWYGAPSENIFRGGVALAANSILLSIIYVPTSLASPPQELLKTLVNINF